MKKIAMFLLYLLFVNVFAFSQTNNIKSITLEIHNVTINCGILHISICRSEMSYRNKRPDFTFEIFPVNTIVRQEINVPLGECVILVYQDINNNGQSDVGFLGIPKEPVGISNWDGRGIPGNFRRHRINIEETTSTLIINLYRL